MKLTIDHEEIRRWAEQHNGMPQRIDHEDATHDRVGIRIDFDGGADDGFLSDDNPPMETSWDEFFLIFDEQFLAFEYDPTEEDPALSYRFTNRGSSDEQLGR